MKTKIKIFYNDRTPKLEAEINNWLSQNEVEIINVSLSEDRFRTIALISYKIPSDNKPVLTDFELMRLVSSVEKLVLIIESMQNRIGVLERKEVKENEQ